jgi:outer membrane protein TolC
MRWLFLVAATAVSAVPLSAQAPGLSLAEVYIRLDRHNPRREAARARAAAAEARIGPASRWPDPAIQFSLMNRNLPGFGLNDPLGMNQVQVMQMIPIAGKTGLAVLAARAEAEAERASADETTWEVRSRAAMAFYDFYLADRTLATMTTSRRLLTDALKASDAMYAEGRGKQTDVLRAQVELARMDEELIRMRAMRDGMRARLDAMTGMTEMAADTAASPPALPHFPDSLPAADSLAQLALARRPMIAAGAARVRSADALTRRAGREIWPDLTLGVIYGQRPMPEGGTDRMLSLMFGFTLPLSPGSRQGQMRAEARAMQAMSVADLTDLEGETRARVAELAADLERARALRVLYRTTLLPQLNAAAAAAEAGYRAGSTDFMTLLESRMAWSRATQEEARFDADTGKALAELEMLTATTLVDPASTAETGGSR